MAAPASRNARAYRANSPGPTSNTVSPSTSRGRPALGWITSGRLVAPAMASRAGSSSRGPTEQLSPTAAAPRAVRVTAAAAGSTPRNVRPSSPKVMVTTAGRPVCSRTASRAALASSRSLMVSMSTRSAPAFSPASAISANMAHACSNRSSPKGSSRAPRGPMSNATYRSVPAARRAAAIPAAIQGAGSSPSFQRLAPKVLAVKISAPAAA